MHHRLPASVAGAVVALIVAEIPALGGCGAAPPGRRASSVGAPPAHRIPNGAIRGEGRLDPADVPRTVGGGPRYRPPAVGDAVTHALPVRAAGRTLTCSAVREPVYGAHLELFAAGHVVIVPAGIGVAPPQRRQGAYVTAGRCLYPLRTHEPTGLVEISPAGLHGRSRVGRPDSPIPTLGELFSVWGQPLGSTRLSVFRREPVRAFLNGRRWRSNPRKLPLARHAQVVLEVGAWVVPHARYAFPNGL